MNQTSSPTESSTIFVVSGSPAQVRGLGVGDNASTELAAQSIALLTQAVQSPSPVAIVCSHDNRWYTRHAGSFRSWGAANTSVGAGHHLGELVARWLLQQSSESAQHPMPEVLSQDSLSGHPTQIVVLDGSAGLSPKAPLAEVPGADEAHEWCTALLAGEGPGSVEKQWLQERGVIEADLWLELEAEIAQRGWSGGLYWSDMSLGVGRYVARWERKG
ncbi:hypothetical protein [Corynebacterium gerontici]|uniref:Uncharacterized protein n=1 Tax=Corynebacterium gerontici TaxID=2079234 RepID=A0A3G6J0W4_9CORY|nr:hypothetical protein [Corynebacterium gerontici]AZA11607.1 hypothetical protein CGERO_06535 [Corynebacterium gerontici]